ncbi:hypothetical protein EKO27_g4973 [Xylaria grammica]|uniref:Fascin domain-containing protein n=1 Tax=Xylaria grammica TaxID=363999 RepID=A0A439D6V2_9PEZI|nr:hypothetical protein EKO27_g4973 [Xylaria grammica]
MDNPWENEDNASIASPDTAAVYTPIHTTEQHVPSRDDPPDARDSVGSAPAPGGTYMIYHQASGNMLSLEQGQLKLRSSPQSGNHWNCIQNHGYFGFIETVSGNFLGRDGNYGFRAEARLHLLWEWFIITHAGDEGYHLQSPHWFSLRWVGIGEDGQTLIDVASIDHAAVWRFVEV